jgi:hypothetical protein
VFLNVFLNVFLLIVLARASEKLPPIFQEKYYEVSRKTL